MGSEGAHGQGLGGSCGPGSVFRSTTSKIFQSPPRPIAPPPDESRSRIPRIRETKKEAPPPVEPSRNSRSEFAVSRLIHSPGDEGTHMGVKKMCSLGDEGTHMGVKKPHNIQARNGRSA